jgi:alkylhydroperoxidase family enzyme
MSMNAPLLLFQITRADVRDMLRADALLEALRAWSGLPAGDDLTLVLVDCARECGSKEA